MRLLTAYREGRKKGEGKEFFFGMKGRLELIVFNEVCFKFAVEKVLSTSSYGQIAVLKGTRVNFIKTVHMRK